MAFTQSETNSSQQPESQAAQMEMDYNLATELAFADENPFHESPEKAALTPNSDKEELQPSPELPSSPPAKIVNIIEETRRLNASTVPLVSDPGGDTWVFISPPSRQPGQDTSQYKAICDHYTIPHCINSDTLKNLNSPAFNSWYSPTPQHRVLRRRGLVGKLPRNIKFVIDLTPQMEGDEGAHLLSELMCPHGIRTWILAMSRWDIPNYLVGGNEDYSYVDSYRRSTAEGQDDAVDYMKPLLDGPGGTLDADEIRVIRRARSVYNEVGRATDATLGETEFIIPACYTAIRHHCGIERVLNILVDNDPKLDSAPKVWTTFVMAKHLGVANHVNLNNYIIRWLRSNDNPAFIDAMPELCLEMADGLQNYALCREAFGILVGERALESEQDEQTSSNGGKTKHALVTIHGRKKYDISEAYETRLEYAYIGFREMVFGEYTELVEGDWIKVLPEFQRLSKVSYKNLAFQTSLHNLRHLLLSYVRGFIMFALRAKPAFITGPHGDRSENDDIFPTTRFALTWERLSLRQRLLTRSFWILLGSMNLRTSISNNAMSEGETWGERTAQYEFHNRELDGESVLEKPITKTELKELLNNCKYKLVAAQNKQKGQAWRTGENTVGNIIASPDKRSSSSTWDKALDKIQSRYIGNLKTSAGKSDCHKAKRPKMEPLNDNKAEPLQGMAPGTLLDLPLSHWVLPKDPGWAYDTSRDEASPARSNQHLASSPYDANYHLTASAQAPWSKVVGTDDIAKRHLSSRAYEQDALPTTEFKFGEQKATSETLFKSQASVTDSKGWWEEDYSIHDDYVDSQNRFFDLEIFFTEANEHISTLCARMLVSKSTRISKPDFGISNILRCLTEDEYKYLPLWAGGNDDGSGGVFDDEIPIPDAQFTTAGPKVFSSGNSSAGSSSSEFDIISRGGSTKNTSTIVLDGFSDTLDRHHTYAASENSDDPSTVGKLASELGDFDMLSDVTAEEYPGHTEAQARSGEGDRVGKAVQKEDDTGSTADTQPSAVALGKARADPDESLDDDFNYDLEEVNTDSEGEDQVFEDD